MPWLHGIWDRMGAGHGTVRQGSIFQADGLFLQPRRQFHRHVSSRITSETAIRSDEISSASNYQNGQSETYVGEWMKARGTRDEMVIATKYTSAWQLAHEDKIQSNFGGNNKKAMVVCVEASLKKLQTSYIDLVSLSLG